MRSVTALDCVLLKDRNPVLPPRQGAEINSRACLWVSPRLRHHIQCWLTNQRLILLRISYQETPKAGSGPTNFRTESSLASSSAISLPRTLACPWTQCNPTACRVETTNYVRYVLHVHLRTTCPSVCRVLTVNAKHLD